MPLTTLVPDHPRPPRSPAIAYEYTPPPRPGLPGILDLAVGSKENTYLVRRGNAPGVYLLDKYGQQGGVVYTVRLDDFDSTCNCKGCLRWNHCKHLDGLKDLNRQGKLEL